MTEDKQKIAERIRKLFALGASANQHEAELAMAKANELMKEHQISMTDVDLAEEGVITQEDYFVDDALRMVNSIGNLAGAVAILYDGNITQRRGNTNGSLRYRFYGTTTDIAAMKMTFAHLYESWKSIVKHDQAEAKKNGLNTATYKNSHMYGYSSALRSRAKALAAARTTEVKAATGRDLVVVKGAAVADFMSNLKFRSYGVKAQVNHSAMKQGAERGNSASFGGISGDKVLQIAGRK